MNARTAAVLVCALLGAGAVASYAVGDRFAGLTGTVRLPHRLADAIPSSMGEWHGTDDPLSDAEVRTTQVDDHVRRRYRSDGGAEVLLYVAYHGNKERGMQTWYHNPTVCFPSQGWTLESERTATETLPDSARPVPVCRYVFAKEALRLSVLTFFQVGGELLDQSPRNKAVWTLLERATPQLDDSPGTFVQAQVIVPVGAGGEPAAAGVQSQFLRAFGSSILRAVDPASAR
jgi:EpsI family protein